VRKVSAGMFSLTERGMGYWEDLGLRAKLPELEEDLIYYIGRGTDHPIEEDNEIKALKTLIRRGLVEESKEPISYLLGKIPEEGGLRGNLEIYTRIAEGKPASDSEIEVLRRSLVRNLEEEYEGEPFLEELRSSKTRSDKVIAIDSGMQQVHAGALPFSKGTIEDYDWEYYQGEPLTDTWKLLNRLRYG